MLLNLKTTLAVRGMKQVDLAHELKIPASTFSEIVNGRRSPDASTRRRIAIRLDAEENWLFSRLVQIPKRESPRGSDDISESA